MRDSKNDGGHLWSPSGRTRGRPSYGVWGRRSVLTLEDEVVREDHYACMYIPGLLQTRAYAEAVHR